MSSKLESDVCYRVAPSGKVMEVTAGLAESNGSLPPSGWLSHLQPLKDEFIIVIKYY